MEPPRWHWTRSSGLRSSRHRRIARVTLDEEIAFWDREAATATKRELAMLALGMAAGLRRARDLLICVIHK
jgi:hypothetical protein